MRNGTYKTKDGETVQVRRTDTGHLIVYPDGRVVVIGGAR